MLNIEPIKLLRDSHSDTAQTGSGCFMNVISYLNGDAQITDKSPCVCETIRIIVMWLNDYMDASERHLLIPFIHRAMGTATTDLDVLVSRARRASMFANESAYLGKHSKYAKNSAKYSCDFAKSSANYVAKYSKYIAKYEKYSKYADSGKFASKYAAKYAEYVAVYAESYKQEAKQAARYAARYAKYAAVNAESLATRNGIIESALRYLDDVCPMTDITTEILVERATRLVELAKRNA